MLLVFYRPTSLTVITHMQLALMILIERTHIVILRLCMAILSLMSVGDLSFVSHSCIPVLYVASIEQ